MDTPPSFLASVMTKFGVAKDERVCLCGECTVVMGNFCLDYVFSMTTVRSFFCRTSIVDFFFFSPFVCLYSLFGFRILNVHVIFVFSFPAGLDRYLVIHGRKGFRVRQLSLNRSVGPPRITRLFSDSVLFIWRWTGGRMQYKVIYHLSLEKLRKSLTLAPVGSGASLRRKSGIEYSMA